MVSVPNEMVCGAFLYYPTKMRRIKWKHILITVIVTNFAFASGNQIVQLVSKVQRTIALTYSVIDESSSFW